MTSYLHNSYYPVRKGIPVPQESLSHREQSSQHPLNILEQRKQIKDVVRLREELTHNQRLLQYEQALRLKQRKSRFNQNYSVQGLKNQRQPFQKSYQELQEKLKKCQKIKQFLQEKSDYGSNRHMSKNLGLSNYYSYRQRYYKDTTDRDFQKIEQRYQQAAQIKMRKNKIQSQKVIQQYQQQLLDKINGSQHKKKLSNLIQEKAYRNKVSVKYQLDDASGGQNIIINKKTINDRYQDLQQNRKKRLPHKDNKKSHSQKLKNSLIKNYQTINANETVKKNFQTINFSSIQESSTRQNYNTINCKKPKNQSKKGKTKRSFLSQRKDTKSTLANTKKGGKNIQLGENPMKRIQNRLKLSMIVFKDSQMKNNRYEFHHLWNKYETEVRLRKEIKDKINNHPKILQKHSLVVSSR